MAEINCPMCGKPNPSDLDVCQFCEARLKPLTDELSRSQPPLHPGEDPKIQDTGELEPILPQWLREVRQQARDSAAEQGEQAPAWEEASQAGEPGDLLAGLQSQAEKDEEIPDWLAGLRGDSAPPTEETSEDDDMSALRSMLGDDAPIVEEPAGEDALSALLAGSADKEEPKEEPAASDSDFEWAADFGAGTGPLEEIPEPVAEGDTPDWLASLGEESAEAAPQEPVQPAVEGDTPEWLASLGEESAEAAPQEPARPAVEVDMPDWLASLGGEATEAAPQEPDQPAVEDVTPDWLSSLGEESVEAAPQEPAQPAVEGDTPDWLASLGEESVEAAPQEPAQSAVEGDTPDWLASLGEESVEAVPQEPVQPAVEGETPDWLASLGEESVEAPPQEPAQPAAEGDTPDWLASLGGEATEAEQPATTPPFTTEEPAEEVEVSAPSAFVDDEGAPLASDDVDAIFSMDMPDWLSEAGSVDQATGEVPLAPADDDLRPADLPSWVQAMRPVESVISETEGGMREDQPMEEKGPLAGLRGVLPAMPGVGPSSRPKAYSVKLQASEDQQANAVMLEQMLASETSLEPLVTQKVVSTQRFLRWIIAALLLLVVGGVVFSRTQMNPMPVGAPPETVAAMRYIQEGLPTDASVLMIFDYEAALAGELEAAAAPFVDHMLTLKAPQLSLLSSTPTGAGLAERFIGPFTAETNHNYQDGKNFVNLGYLPGGAAGVLAFAENPASIKPMTIAGKDAWNTPVLQDVGRLSDFAAIILLTNDVETARIWIEQTETARGETRLLVISSAQSGPMILPYVQTGQVDGMVTGLDGSAPIEQVNSGRPGMVRRYWDAFGLGLLTALAMISFGSLWSLIAGWQARRKERGEA